MQIEKAVCSEENSHDRLENGEALTVLFRDVVPITGVTF